MKCSYCKKDLEEKDIQESHDVPCYLFLGKCRRLQKQDADKFGRHWLCNKCHKKYEYNLNLILKLQSIKFAKEYFKDDSFS